MSYLVVLDYTNSTTAIYNDADINPTDNDTFNYDEWIEEHYSRCETSHIFCETVEINNVSIILPKPN